MSGSGGALVADLKKLLVVAERDLRATSDNAESPWAQGLRAQYEAAREHGRTAFTWSVWRDDEVAQAAVAWVLATVFVRFCEDNDLIEGGWIGGEGDRGRYALDAESDFYLRNPSFNARDWLRAAFSALAELPAGAGIFDRQHSPIWTAPLSADACSEVLSFWRATNTDGSILRSLASDTWDTRFLGDIYQDLSESAKKKYALLQTPEFVEEFILDQTLEPALTEFGLDGLRLIDPACGSGHFLLGAFDRLLVRWDEHAPGVDRRERVQAALDHIHGVDLNPFAIAIARFRLTIAALRASGLKRLSNAPAFGYHLAVGDSLLAGTFGRQGDLLDPEFENEGAAGFAYATEDVLEHPGILEPGRYHVVVGNPPYITVKDKALNEAYRLTYPSCKGKYALSVPFMELLFRLAIRGTPDQPAGFVGQITSNSFMKREFGSKVIEGLLAGNEPNVPVDLTTVIDTSGAYIPGHGTPTVILIGRKRNSSGPIRAVLGIRGEPGQPKDPAEGLVWTEIVDHLGDPGFDGAFVSVVDFDRTALDTFPWSLSGGGAVETLADIERVATRRLIDLVDVIGFAAITGEDDVFVATSTPGHPWSGQGEPARPFVEGDLVRDFSCETNLRVLFPRNLDGSARPLSDNEKRYLWQFRTGLRSRLYFGQTSEERGFMWFDHAISFPKRTRIPLSIAFAFVATHNHFVLDRGGKVFKQSAPVIKLPEGATEDDHLALLGILNSSTACFWLKQVSYPKSGDPQPWADRYEFTGTKLEEFPLPPVLPFDLGKALDSLAEKRSAASAIRAGSPSPSRLAAAHAAWDAASAEMITTQEELDWVTYALYGLTDQAPGLTAADPPPLVLGERAFEIVLARRIADGSEWTAWFERHGSVPITEIPAHWPAEYRDVVQRRIDLIESDRSINLLERPEFKRRWASKSWEEMEREAVTAWCLDRLEDPALWRDEQGPRTLSVTGLASLVRHDSELHEALGLLAGTEDFDLTAQLWSLLKDEAVPFLAAYRYKEPGMVKRAEWEAVWDLQRREDRGEIVDIPVPPKYGQADFHKTSYWKARGKLDVPKERFISYPSAGRGADSSDDLGWAGWDQVEQAQALAGMLMQRSTEEGWDASRLTPLLAGLAELEPWLHQWYAETDEQFGGSPAELITGLLEQQLNLQGVTRADLASWRPPAATRGRRA